MREKMMTHPKSANRAPKKLHTEIVERIKTMIQENELLPGSRLPAERKLAQNFGVSRNSVREAIKQLEEGGVLESRTGAGTYVATGDKNILIQALARELERGRTRIREIFEIRTLLEPQIAGLAATRITAAQTATLWKIIEKQKLAVNHIKKFTALDTRFHALIVQAAGNEVLEQVMTTLHTILKESRSAPLMTTKRQQTSIKGHTAIVAALETKNAQETHKAMWKHIQDIEPPVQSANFS